MDIGRRIKTARKRAQLSQDGLARLAGMSVSAVAQIEQGGRTDPHYSTLEKLAGALDISVGELVGDPVPLGEAPTSSEPAESEGTEEERRTPAMEEIRALQALQKRRFSRFDREVTSPESTKFRTATIATDWLADIKYEVTDWLVWSLERAMTTLSSESPEVLSFDARQILAFVLGTVGETGRIVRLAEQRINVMHDQPDAVALARDRAASRELKAAEDRVTTRAS